MPTLANRCRLAEVYRALRPRVVFIPYWHDAHPDHTAATLLAEQARFHAKLTKTKMAGRPHYAPRVIYYYCTHLRRSADVAFVIDVSGQTETKTRAIECYRSQFWDGRGAEGGAVLQYVLQANRYWGMQISRSYGEPFALRETLGIDSIEHIF